MTEKGMCCMLVPEATIVGLTLSKAFATYFKAQASRYSKGQLLQLLSVRQFNPFICDLLSMLEELYLCTF